MSSRDDTQSRTDWPLVALLITSMFASTAIGSAAVWAFVYAFGTCS